MSIFAPVSCQGELAEMKLDLGIFELPGQMLSYYPSNTLSNIAVYVF